ncbi:hypothetical protein [Glycomyces xiaoerkulensis]|uniref:hypothetical protein n=1 Tax=Glycomyces xiaoerkulensis TaxID=2038139 RepID=UPI0018E4D9CB|nr:hypothetical protein [Glycomyces xiaoerkulensis]
MSQLSRAAGRAFLGGLAAGGTIAAIGAVRRSKWATDLDRVNHRGETVSLAEGPGVTVGATAASVVGASSPAYAAAAATVGLTGGALGLYDDIADARGEKAKGFKGHVAALRKGRISAGLAKLLGISSAGLAGAALVDAANAERHRSRSSRLWNIGVAGGVVAGTANLINLFDLRPGRALKVVSALAAPLTRPPGPKARKTAAGGAGTAIAVSSAAAAAMSDDLEGKTMLGDCGANALGALLGLAFIARTGPVGRHLALAGLAALIGASERVSFTRVIADTPGLRELDELGRNQA